MLLNIAINPFIAMNMSPEDYSILGYFTSFNSLISPIIPYYFIHYYQKRHFELNEEQRRELESLIFRSLILLSGAISLICFAGLLVYIHFFAKTISFPIFPYLLFTVATVYLNGIYCFQQSEYKMSRRPSQYTKLTIFVGLINVTLTLLFVVIIKLGALGKFVAPLLCNFSVFIYLLLRNRELWKVKVSIKSLKPIIIFCTPLTVGAALGYFTNGFDRTYLEQLGDVTEYGNYIVGTQIGLYINVFAAAISTTFSPDICESIATNNQIRFWKYSVLQVSLISIVVLIFIIVCPFAIKILTAGRYMGAVQYASLIAISSITSSIYYIINYYSIATNRPRLYLYTTIIGTLIIIGLYPIVIPAFKYVGGAVMVVVSYVILSLINIILLKLIK